MILVLLDALGVVADVQHLAVVITREYGDEVVREENGVVVSHDKPPHIRQAEPKRLFNEPRNTDGRLRVHVVEQRPSTVRNADRDCGAHHVGQVVKRLALKPREAARGVGGPPERAEEAAVVPRVLGPSDAEEDVGEVGGRRRVAGVVGEEPPAGRVGEGRVESEDDRDEETEEYSDAGEGDQNVAWFARQS